MSDKQRELAGEIQNLWNGMSMQADWAGVFANFIIARERNIVALLKEIRFDRDLIDRHKCSCYLCPDHARIIEDQIEKLDGQPR